MGGGTRMYGVRRQSGVPLGYTGPVPLYSLCFNHADLT